MAILVFAILGNATKIETIMSPQTSKKDRLSTGQYCQPRLQELVVPVAPANIIAPLALPIKNIAMA
jgi:hypothetical protein